MSAAPDHILLRFREITLGRLDQLEGLWLAQDNAQGPRARSNEMMRVAHTIKGDARIVGFADVGFLCHKLEELLILTSDADHVVTEDFDLVVTMALRFLGMLVRKPAGASLGGIDLTGFAGQIDGVITETKRKTNTARTAPSVRFRSSRILPLHDRVEGRTIHRLARAATNVYIESIQQTGHSRTRLLDTWSLLKTEVSQLWATAVAPRIGRHAEPARELAKELGKLVDIQFNLRDVRAADAVAEALDLSAMHAIRNALDHGIESPEERVAKGKDKRGVIEVTLRRSGDSISMYVRDDGRGIDVDELRTTLVKAGELSSDAAAKLDRSSLLDGVFAPSVSTKSEAGPISGRGVGLDAVRDSVRRVGGTSTVVSPPGHGCEIQITVPCVGRRIWVNTFPSVCGRAILAVPDPWTATPVQSSPDAIDPLTKLHLSEVEPKHKPLTLEIAHGSDTLHFIAGGPPTRTVARRSCPTNEDDAAEVVFIGKESALLIRPKFLCGDD